MKEMPNRVDEEEWISALRESRGGEMMLFDTSAIINIYGSEEVEKLKDHTSALAICEIGNAIWKQVCQKKRLSMEEEIKVLDVMNEVLESFEILEMDEPKIALKIVENSIPFTILHNFICQSIRSCTRYR